MEKKEDIAILFPGLSLKDYYKEDPGRFRTIVSVNFASHLFSSDYVALYDIDCNDLLAGMIEPTKGYITKPAFPAFEGKEIVISPIHGLNKRRLVAPSDPLFDHMSKTPRYTATFAFGQALEWLRTGEEIHCFGLDLKPEYDCVGQGIALRSNKRFLSEIIWMRLLGGSRANILSNAYLEVKHFIKTGEGFKDVLRLYS